MKATTGHRSVVTLRCEFSPSPGSDFTNSLRFEQAGNKVLVRDSARDSDTGSNRGTETIALEGLLTWHLVAGFVGDPEWGGALDNTGLEGKPSVGGLLQWESEAVLICWRRYGAAESIAEDLLSLSDRCARLSLIYKGLHQVADALVRISELRSNLGYDELAGPLARRFGISDDADCLGHLVLRLEREPTKTDQPARNWWAMKAQTK